MSTQRPAVFVVHGHDHATRDKLVAFLRKQSSFETIVLEEEANQGKTIIEKFEAHARRAKYAIVIATPDDVGCSAADLEKWEPVTISSTAKVTSPPVKPRPRQNVVLEWGYFAGKLGRENVMIITIGEVELPSDLSGILEARENLELAVLRELKAAGLDVDLA